MATLWDLAKSGNVKALPSILQPHRTFTEPAGAPVSPPFNESSRFQVCGGRQACRVSFSHALDYQGTENQPACSFPHEETEVQRGDVMCHIAQSSKPSWDWNDTPDSQPSAQLPASHCLLGDTHSNALRTGILEAQARSQSSGATPTFRLPSICEEVKKPTQTEKSPGRNPSASPSLPNLLCLGASYLGFFLSEMKVLSPWPKLDRKDDIRGLRLCCPMGSPLAPMEPLKCG